MLTKIHFFISLELLSNTGMKLCRILMMTVCVHNSLTKFILFLVENL